MHEPKRSNTSDRNTTRSTLTILSIRSKAFGSPVDARGRNSDGDQGQEGPMGLAVINERLVGGARGCESRSQESVCTQGTRRSVGEERIGMGPERWERG